MRSYASAADSQEDHPSALLPGPIQALPVVSLPVNYPVEPQDFQRPHCVHLRHVVPMANSTSEGWMREECRRGNGDWWAERLVENRVRHRSCCLERDYWRSTAEKVVERTVAGSVGSAGKDQELYEPT